jgi:hypothetical protein
LATDGTVDVPVLGKEKKSTALLALAAAVGVIGFAVIEKRKQAAAAAAAAASSTAAGQFTDPAGNVCAAPDPNTGYCPGTAEDQAAQAQLTSEGELAAGSGGYGTGVIPVFTSNAAWAQYAEQELGSDGADATAAAIAAYLSGQALTEAQVTIVEEATAIAGPPPVPGPNGFPPSMNTTTASTSSSPAGAGSCASGFTWSATQTGASGEVAATGGNGWCEPPGTPAAPAAPVSTATPGTTTTPAAPAAGKPITVAPSGFRVVSVTNGDDVNLAWDPLTPPAGEGPLTGYMIAYGPTSGSQQYKQQVGGQTTEATVPGVGAGTAGSHYFELWALPAQAGGPHAGPIEASTTKS